MVHVIRGETNRSGLDGDAALTQAQQQPGWDPHFACVLLGKRQRYWA